MKASASEWGIWGRKVALRLSSGIEDLRESLIAVANDAKNDPTAVQIAGAFKDYKVADNRTRWDDHVGQRRVNLLRQRYKSLSEVPE